MKALALVCIILAACRTSAPPLRLGTTYTVQQSGALGVLESQWTGTRLSAVIAPSGQILRSAASGDLDVVITHAPALEQSLLVTPGHALLRCPLVASRFAIVGPAKDPARVAGAASAAAAFSRIAAARAPFISRGDSSGTHVKELALWRAAAVTPAAPWYVQSGTDQAATLHLADERDAYALADLPTYGQLRDLRLRVLFSGDTALTNPYTLYVVAHAAAPAEAQRFAEWASGAGRAAIMALRLQDGQPAFAAPREGCATVGGK